MLKKIIMLTAFAIASFNANAYTECKANVQTVFTGEDGSVVATFDTAPATVFQNQTSVKNELALLLTATSSSLPVIVRWNSDGVACLGSGAARGDVGGIWITR